ncbi:MAG: tRNA guanosine(34) transglycosylase Tgt [bacterium]|nr:tRNA guanosine(34) transglycosylase Tgt [bacterium]
MFKILQKDKKTRARVGKMTTLHGVVRTPVFMPCGTQGTVKSITPKDLKEIGIQILLGNTYHLYLRPGEKLIKNFGGLHKFMGWDGPILTDSGGYQVTSLGKAFARGPRSSAGPAARSSQGARASLSFGTGRTARLGSPPLASPASKNIVFDEDLSEVLVRIDDEGVTFRSHWDGSEHRFTPEKAIQIQQDLGADIIMAFDEATPLGASHEYAKKVLNRTHRWALRSLIAQGKHSKQALFGIIQGGFYKDLRRESARFIGSLNFDGIAVGGGDVGSDLKRTGQIFEWIEDSLPKDKPLYAMGVGVYPQDVLDIIRFGVDMFDCVAPTRLARSGILYTGKLKKTREWFAFESEYGKGRLLIQKAEFRTDKKPIDKDCSCYTCRNFSRAYLYHLFRVRELLAYRLATYHNLYFMTNLVKQIRESIIKG